MKSFSVILPTLNEEGHITQLINEIVDCFNKENIVFEIIVVDDNSTDGTIGKIRKLKNNSSIDLSLFVRNEKKNLAKSINLGIKNSKYEYVIWMDADYQHPPQYINKIFNHIDNFDLIIFSRFLKESKRYFEEDKSIKEFNEDQSILFNKVSNMLLFNDITDYTSGYICMNKKILNNFDLKGFYGEYFVDLIVHCKIKNFKILELPFIEKKRQTGESKTIGYSKFRYLVTTYFYFLAFMRNCFKVLFKSFYR